MTERLPELDQDQARARAAQLIREHGMAARAYILERANECQAALDLEQTNRWRDILREALLLLSGAEQSLH